PAPRRTPRASRSLSAIPRARCASSPSAHDSEASRSPDRAARASADMDSSPRDSTTHSRACSKRDRVAQRLRRKNAVLPPPADVVLHDVKGARRELDDDHAVAVLLVVVRTKRIRHALASEMPMTLPYC